MKRALSPEEEKFVLVCQRRRIKSFSLLQKAAEEAGLENLLESLKNKILIRKLHEEKIYLNDFPEFCLSDKEYAYVNEYMIDFSAVDAARRLGYEDPSNAANRLGNKPGVRMEIIRRQAQAAKLSLVNADRVLEEYVKIAYADITDFVSYEDNVLSLRSSDQIDGAVVEEITEGPNGLKIKLHSKMKALEMLAKHVGVAREKLEITGKDGKDLIDTNPMAALISKLDMISKNKEQVEEKDKGSIT